MHEAPDLDAVDRQVGLDLGGQQADDAQVDAQQLHALLQQCRDRPAQSRVVPGPHSAMTPNQQAVFGRTV
jgi:hypothetical protein